MNEEISVTLRNNTNQIQPVNLFTEIFAIPSNITGGATNIYSWDLSTESFNTYFNSTFANIQYSTSPITNLTPSTSTGILPTNDINGLVTELNLLGVGTFTSVGNIISVTSSTYFFGTLSVSAEIYSSVSSTTPSVQPALEIFVNGTLFLSVLSGISSNNVLSGGINAGDTILVNYNVGAGAITWLIIIENYIPPYPTFINLLNQTGAGAFSGSFTFTYPSSGNISITLNIVP